MSAPHTIANLAVIADSWVPTVSSSERERRRKTIERTLADTTLPNISLLREEHASALVQIAVPLVFSTSASIVNVTCFVLAQSAFILRAAGALRPGSNGVAVGSHHDSLVRTLSDLMAAWISGNEAIPPQDSAAVRVGALRVGASLLPLLDRTIVAGLYEEHHLQQRVPRDLADLAQRQQFQKRTFSQGKASQEQQYEETAHIRVALLDFATALHRHCGPLVPEMDMRVVVVPILHEPGYKPRDVLVCRAALHCLYHCAPSHVALSQAVASMPQTVDVLFELAMPPAKQKMKLLWQEGQRAHVPIWDEVAAILAGGIVAKFGAMLEPDPRREGAPSEELVLAAQRLSVFLRHPSNAVFLGLVTRVTAQVCSPSLFSVLMHHQPDAVSEAPGSIAVERLANLASCSSSPAHATGALRALHSLLHQLLVLERPHTWRPGDDRCLRVAHSEWSPAVIGAAAHMLTTHKSWRTCRGQLDAAITVTDAMRLRSLCLFIEIGAAQTPAEQVATKRSVFRHFALLGNVDSVLSRMSGPAVADLIYFVGLLLCRRLDAARNTGETSLDALVASQFVAWLCCALPHIDDLEALRALLERLHSSKSLFALRPSLQQSGELQRLLPLM